MTHEYTDSMQTRFEKGQIIPAIRIRTSFNHIIDEIDRYQTIMMSSLFSTKKALDYKENLQFKC